VSGDSRSAAAHGTRYVLSRLNDESMAIIEAEAIRAEAIVVWYMLYDLMFTPVHGIALIRPFLLLDGFIPCDVRLSSAHACGWLADMWLRCRLGRMYTIAPSLHQTHYGLRREHIGAGAETVQRPNGAMQ